MIFQADYKTARPVQNAFVVLGLVWGCVAGMLPAIKAHVGISDAALGQVLLVASIGAVIVLVNIERILPMVGARALFWFSGVLPLCVVGTVMVGTVVGFLIVLLAFAMFSAGLDVSMNARMAEAQMAAKRQVMNYAHGVYGLSYAVGAVYAGILQEFGLSRGLIAVLLVGICAGLVRALWAVIPRQESAEEVKPMRGALWFVLALGAIGLISLLTEQAVDLWAGIYIERGLSDRPLFLALGPAALGLTLGIGRFGAQRFGHKVAPLLLITCGGSVAALGGALVAIGASLISVYIGFALMGLGVSIIFPSLLNTVANTIPENRRVWAISRVSAMSYAGTFFGPPMVGFVSEAYSLSVAFWVITGLVVVIPVIGVPLVRYLSVK